MASRYKTPAFVFKTENRLDSDRLFFVFAKDLGRLEIFAKSIRNIDAKLRGGMQLFCFSEIEFIQGRYQKTLTDARLLYGLHHKNPEGFRLAAIICTALDEFILGQERDLKIWDLLASFFKNLDDFELTPDNWRGPYYYFLWNFFAVLGYAGEFSQCAKCHQDLNPNQLYFSCSEGGVVCKSCTSTTQDAKNISVGVVKLLRIVVQQNWQLFLKVKMPKSQWREFGEISENYYRYLRPES